MQVRAYKLGYMKLIVTLRKGKDTTMVDIQFLIVPCKSVYNCILGRPFAATLDILVSPVHLKSKYHNVSGEAVCTDLSGSHRIYKREAGETSTRH